MPENILTFSLTVFTGFFAIMNPIANTPIFLALVEGREEKTKKRIARTGTITAFIIVVAFIILGKYIFEIFGITIPAFKITGGILVFFVGFEMLQSKKSKIHHQQNVDTDDGKKTGKYRQGKCEYIFWHNQSYYLRYRILSYGLKLPL